MSYLKYEKNIRQPRCLQGREASSDTDYTEILCPFID